jgi:Ca-activated chloride channel family protein
MINRRKYANLWIVLLLFLAGWTVQPLLPVQRKISIQRADLSGLPEISVYFTLTDADGQSILGISESELGLFIDDVEQKITHLQSALEGGEFLAVGLVIDRSGSMKESMPQVKEAALNFVKRMSEGDRIALVTFDDRVTVNAGFSGSKDLIAKAIDGITLGKDTALYDGVGKSLELLEDMATRRQAVIILSDGKDNRSQTPKEAILAEARKRNISLFAIGLGADIDEGSLTELAGDTGGAFFKAAGPGDLLLLYQTIADQLNNQYKLIFSSTFGRDDSWHTLRIAYHDPSGEAFEVAKTFLSTTSPGVSRGTLSQAQQKGEQKQLISAGGLGGLSGLVLALLILVVIRLARPESEFKPLYTAGIIITAIILGGILGFLYLLL